MFSCDIIEISNFFYIVTFTNLNLKDLQSLGNLN